MTAASLAKLAEPTAVIGWVPVEVGQPARSTWHDHRPTRGPVAKDAAGPVERAGMVALSGALAAGFAAVIAAIVAGAADVPASNRIALGVGAVLALVIAAMTLGVGQTLRGSGSGRGDIHRHRVEIAEAQFAEDMKIWDQRARADDERLLREWENLPRFEELRLAAPPPTTRLADVIGGTLEGAATLIQHWAVREAFNGRRVLVLDLTRNVVALELLSGWTLPSIESQYTDVSVWPRDGWTRDPFTDATDSQALLGQLASTLSKEQSSGMYPLMDFIALVCETLRANEFSVTLPNVLRAVRAVRERPGEVPEEWRPVARALQARAGEFSSWDDITGAVLSMFNVILRRDAEPSMDQRPTTLWGDGTTPVQVVALDPRLPAVIRSDLAGVLAECLAGLAGEARFDQVFVLGSELLEPATAKHLSDQLTRSAQVVYWMEVLPPSYNELQGSVANYVALQITNAAQAEWMSALLGTNEQFVVSSLSQEWGESYGYGTSSSREYSYSEGTSRGVGGGSSTTSETRGESSGFNQSWTTTSSKGRTLNLTERAVVRADAITSMPPTRLLAVSGNRRVVCADFHPNIPYEFITRSDGGEILGPLSTPTPEPAIHE